MNEDEIAILNEKLSQLDIYGDKRPLIENPFTNIDTFVKPRLSLAKEPINKIGNTDYINMYHTENGNIELDNQLDPKCNYICGANEEMINNPFMVVPLDKDKLDYEVPAEYLNTQRTDGLEPHKDNLPLSFLNIKTEEDGLLWYSKNYPKIPDDLLPIIARYHWGDKLNKQTIKKESKKNKKKVQKVKDAIGLERREGKFLVKFD